jgi:hypothetical protein
MSRIMIYISDEEINALRVLAKEEFRELRSQVAFIIRKELERRGLLASTIPPINNPSVQEVKSADEIR